MLTHMPAPRLLPACRMGLPHAVHTCMSVARALVTAHAAGIIHADLKPSNVLMGLLDGRLEAKVGRWRGGRPPLPQPTMRQQGDYYSLDGPCITPAQDQLLSQL